MKKNENSDQKQIYLKALKRKILVSKKLHREYFREIDACRVRQWVHGRCGCPRHEWDSCDMDCQTCSFWLGEGTLSLDAEMIIDGRPTTLAETVPDKTADVENILMKAELLDALYRELAALEPEGRKMCELFMEGKSERESAKIMAIPQTTYNRHWQKVKKLLNRKLRKYKK